MAEPAGDPLRTLLSARDAFGASTEAEAMLRIVDRFLRQGDIEWLEVGAGDGRDLSRSLRRLSAGRRIRATALEPSPTSPMTSADVQWRRMRVEDYALDQNFDWVSMRHCAYYLTDPLAQIERLTAALSVHGVLALTHWSRDCVLQRLHRDIAGDNENRATAGIEELAAALRSKGLDVDGPELHPTSIDVEEVIARPELAAALFELARRDCPSRLPAGTDPAAFVAGAFRHLPDARVRVNGVLLVRKARG